MSEISIAIRLSMLSNIENLLERLNESKDLKVGDTINLTLNCNGTVYPQYLCALVAWVKLMKSKGINLNFNIKGENTYVSRMDFYKHIEYEYSEEFRRHNSTGRFIEITEVDGDNSIEIVGNTIKVIENNIDLEESVLKCLNYCLFEVIDNIEEHSGSPINGYIVVQNYQYEGVLRIAIIDAGVGIYNSLRNSGKPEFKDITESGALRLCINKGVTRFDKRGRGLYHTSNFIRANNGKLEMYSGNHVLKINHEGIDTDECSFWQGLITYFEINTRTCVDFEEVFEDEIPITVEESYEMLNGYSDLEDYI